MGFNGIGHFADLFGTTAVEQLFQHQHQQQQQQSYQLQQHYEECCVPTGDCVMRSAPIRPEDPRAAELYARVVCSDGSGCPAGQYMHRECYDAWERLVVAYMMKAYANGGTNNNNNNRSNNNINNNNNADLWTVNVNNNNAVNLNKKGYDMAFKACGCRCGRGFLKRDTEWPSAVDVTAVRRQSSGGGSSVDDADRAAVGVGKKKKRRQAKNHSSVVAPLQQSIMMQQPMSVDYTELRLRTGSLSGSSNGSSSPVTNSTSSVSPAHSGSFGSSTAGSSGSSSMSKRRGAAAASFKDVFERCVDIFFLFPPPNFSYSNCGAFITVRLQMIRMILRLQLRFADFEYFRGKKRF